jgi:hypothetical protein
MNTYKCKYTYSDKVKALRMLEKNTFNYLKTSRQTQIARPTLRKWERLYGKEVFKGKSLAEEALVEIDAEHNDVNIIRHLYVIRKSILQRVGLLAESETKLEALVNLMRYVSFEIEKISEMGSPGNDSTVDYIAIIANQLVENQKVKSQLGE